MLAKEITLLLILIFIAQSAVLGNTTEGPIPFTDFNSQEFKKVFDAVKNQRLEVSNWVPSKATKLVANGTRYKFRLTSGLG